MDVSFGTICPVQIAKNYALSNILCAKKSLNLPKLCRSDISESLFDVLPISAEIDTRKLLFLGRLCRMDTQTVPKKYF